ncbi:MAG: phage holin family protein [Fimbriimonadaceae bacterium]|nr:phage holin family protein [Fimbriimonadaceae bacterium]
MKRLVLRWVLSVVALVVAAYLTGYVLPKHLVVDTSVAGILKMFVGVAVIGLLNTTLGKLLKFMTIPLNCLTMGLFSLAVNAAMFLVAGNLNLGFRVEGFLGALLGSILYSAMGGVLGILVKEKDEDG